MHSYRWENLFLRSKESNLLKRVNGKDFYAHETLPNFMVEWWYDAAPQYWIDRIITSTVNASHRCVIWEDALCGQFCFAHAEKEWLQWLRRGVVDAYVHEQKRLAEMWLEASIFLSTDIEPLPGNKNQQSIDITDITERLLRAMAKNPPAGLILHTHTDIAIKSDTLAILKDVRDATNLIVGVGFETDEVNLPDDLPPPCTTIENRMKTIEVLANNWIKTQAAVAPLVGFNDFESFAKRFLAIWAYRIMVGDLRLDFAIWWTKKAATLKARLGLPAPTQEEAKACFESLGYPWELVAYRDQFYVVLPEKK